MFSHGKWHFPMGKQVGHGRKIGHGQNIVAMGKMKKNLKVNQLLNTNYNHCCFGHNGHVYILQL